MSAGTFVDSSVLLDVFTEDPKWGDWSTSAVASAARGGPLVINAVVFAEVAPRFSRLEDLDAALPTFVLCEEIPRAAAFLAGHAHSNYRRSGGGRSQILPDFIIGAHAATTRRPLLTRDPRRVAQYLPGAQLITPDKPA